MLNKYGVSQVSDGKDMGVARVLRISASPLRVAKVANTGLVVARGAARLVTADNLTFVTNAAPHQSIDVSYRVLEPPFDGELQVLESLFYYCPQIRRLVLFFFSLTTITHKPLHIAWRNLVCVCISSTARTLLNVKVVGQRLR